MVRSPVALYVIEFIPSPFAPVGPVTPTTPVAPVLPTGPVGPVGPAGPLAEYREYGTLSIFVVPIVTKPEPSSIETLKNLGPLAQLMALNAGVPDTVPAPITRVKRPTAFVLTPE
jgi:hypothetical protein